MEGSVRGLRVLQPSTVRREPPTPGDMQTYHASEGGRDHATEERDEDGTKHGL